MNVYIYIKVTNHFNFNIFNNKQLNNREREEKKMQPKREILSMMDMGKWKKSKVWSISIRLYVN